MSAECILTDPQGRRCDLVDVRANFLGESKRAIVGRTRTKRKGKGKKREKERRESKENVTLRKIEFQCRNLLGVRQEKM